jgi:hypothetical protein
LQQPDLFSPETPHGSPGSPTGAGLAAPPRRAPASENSPGDDATSTTIPRSAIWLRRLDLVLRVVVHLNLGLLLLALPWMHFWDFFTAYARLGAFGESGAVRGLVSGLGLLNIWIAFSDAVYYRDSRA